MHRSSNSLQFDRQLCASYNSAINACGIGGLAGLTDTCNPVNMAIVVAVAALAIVVAVGAALGWSVAGLIMLAMGLGPLGPIAGGAFAGAQAAGGTIVAGSWMAVAQSAAMTGTITCVCTGVGGAVAAIAVALAACLGPVPAAK